MGFNRTRVVSEKLLAKRDFGAKGDNSTNDTAALQAWAAALSIATGTPEGYIEPGTYRTFDTITISNPSVTIQAKDPVSTTLFRQNAGDVLVLQNNGGVANVSRNTGKLEGLRVMGNTSSKPHNGFAAIVVDGLHWYEVNRCETLWTDIGYDLRNNCYLTRFNQCTTNLGTSHNVGMLLRGTVAGAIAGSGSDIEVNNCGIAGSHAAAWCEPNAGGYHFQRGQLTGGSNNVTANDDGSACLVMGRMYIAATTIGADATSGATTLTVTDGTKLPTNGQMIIGNGPTNVAGPVVTWTGKTGNVLTGVTGLTANVTTNTEVRYQGSCTSIRLNGVSTEGSQRCWIMRSFNAAWSVHWLGTDHVGHSWPDSPLGLFKITSGIWNVSFKGARITGDWQATAPENMYSLSGESNSQNIVVEEQINGAARLNNTTTYTWDAKPPLAYAADVKGYQQIHGRYGRVMFIGNSYMRSNLAGDFERWNVGTGTWVPLGGSSSGGSSLARVVSGGNLGATPSVAFTSTDGQVLMTGTLTADATLTITGMLAGQVLRLGLAQDTTGGRTLQITLGTQTLPVMVNTAASSSTLVYCIYDGTDLWVEGA